jgi:hypothetical protein
MSLDDVLRSLLDPRQPWQSQRTTSGFSIRYRATRLSGGLGLAYQPGGVYSRAETLTLSRPYVDVSAVEVKTVTAALARILGQPDLKWETWDERQIGRVHRLYWTRPQRLDAHTVHQAVVYDRNEQYEEEWLSLGITTNRDEAAEWLRRDQQLYLLQGQVVSYQVAIQEA